MILVASLRTYDTHIFTYNFAIGGNLNMQSESIRNILVVDSLILGSY